MNPRKRHVIGWTIAAMFLATGTRLSAQEQKPFSPALEQLRETVCERLQTVSDQLGLTPEQRATIREGHAAFADKFQALRTKRRELLQSEFEAIRDVLTPEQREMAKDLVEDRREAASERGARRSWPEVVPLRETMTERIQATAEKLALTPEQKSKIREVGTTFAEKYRANRTECRDLVEAEFKSIAKEMTPEERDKAKRFVEGRMMRAAAVLSVADRLHAAADELGLTDEQRDKIRKIHAGFRDKYHALADRRRTLLHDEFTAIKGQLTSDQQDRMRDLCEDRVVVVGIAVEPKKPDDIGQLRETIADRLRATADMLGLSQTQRTAIRQIHAGFEEKYDAQKNQRRELRHEELKALGAILSPEQMAKVKRYTEDWDDSSN